METFEIWFKQCSGGNTLFDFTIFLNLIEPFPKKLILLIFKRELKESILNIFA